MKRSGFKTRGKPLNRNSELKRSGPIRQKAPQKPAKWQPAISARETAQNAQNSLKSAVPANFEAKPRPKERKTKKKKKTIKPWERCHLREVKRLSCIRCRSNAYSDAHHCYHDRATKFDGKKAPHLWTIPLCKCCHTDGPEAIHKIKTTWRERYGPDWSYVPQVLVAIYGAELTEKQIKQYWKERGYRS